MSTSAYAVNFDGSSQYASVIPSMTYLGACTVEMWVYMTTYKFGSRLFEAFNTIGVDTNDAITLALDTSTSNLTARNKATPISAFSTAIIPLNTWTHVAMVTTAAAGLTTLYLNGVSKGTSACGAIVSGVRSYTWFGKSMNIAQNKNFTGKMSEMRIWSIERSASDILNNYTKTLSSNTASLVINVTSGILKNAAGKVCLSADSPNSLFLVNGAVGSADAALTSLLTNLNLTVATTPTAVSAYGYADGSIIVDATGPGKLQYTWTDSGAASSNTSSVRKNLTAGTYVVTVSNGVNSVSSGTITISQPAPALYLVATPVTVTATWSKQPSEKKYKVVYRKTGDLSDTVAYTSTNANSVALKALLPSSTYTVKIYSSTVDRVLPSTLVFTGTASTPVLSVGNFTKAPLVASGSAAIAPYYDINYLSNTSVSVNTSSVLTSAFVTGDRLKSTGRVSGRMQPINPKVVKVADSVTIKSVNDSITVPFDSAGVSNQSVTLTLRNGSTASVTYNNTVNSITVGASSYKSGDVFYLDGQRVSVV